MIREMIYRLGSNKKRIEILRKMGAAIGEDCLIAGNVSFGSEPYLIKIGDNVKLTNGVTLVTHEGGVYVLRKYKNLPKADLFGRIEIGDNVFIGNRATIMPNVRIGSNCIIGYGSIVTENVPDNSVVVGVPGRRIRSIDEFYEKVKNNLVDTKEMKWEEKKKYLTEKWKEKT